MRGNKVRNTRKRGEKNETLEKRDKERMEGDKSEERTHAHAHTHTHTHTHRGTLWNLL